MPGTDGQLTYINPVELHDYWPLVVEGLKVVQDKSTDGWIPEDVYACLRAGTSTLHIAYDGEDYVGFIVLTPQQQFDGQKLHIWCAYGVGENIIERYFPEIENMGRRIGAKQITFASSRKGWSKYFTPLTTIYKRDI